MSNKQNLLLLFERPQEPVFIEKGPNKAVFDVPSEFIPERYRDIGMDISSHFSEMANEKIPVRSDVELPDLELPLSLGRHEQFSLFIPRHRKLAGKLIDSFMKLKTYEELQAVAIYARDRINPFLFNYALSVAILHRPDTKDLNVPLFVEVFPEKYVDSKIFARIREEAFIVPEGLRKPIEIPKDYTLSEEEIEHNLWYFREDIGVNLHHWHWHLVYPFEAFSPLIVAKDRRGEMFYYMHEQILARYNLERFSNNMPRIEPFKSLREPISDAYFPKMESLITSRAWPARPANTQLTNLNRQLDQIKANVSDIELWSDRFKEACQSGFAIDPTGDKHELDEYTGIDMLGNMMESSIQSIDRAYYGDIHNMGHTFISYAHDPEHRHLESFGVMGDSATAIRDPAFYRWHAYIDNMFQIHKEKLPPYTKQEIGYDDIKITDFSFQSDDVKAMNEFRTFWQQSDVDLSRGMDFLPKGNVYARFTHLQHIPFTYSVRVTNDKKTQARGTVRIFLSSKYDENGKEWKFKEQRRQMTEMDRFTVNLHPGDNIVRRKSTESTVAIPYEQTFRNIDNDKPPEPGTPNEYAFNFCGCGWPQHMLVPRGRNEKDGGLHCELFVMISNYEDDAVEQDLTGTCRDASAYCGIRDRLYPDRRNMGFPFDRLSEKKDGTLKEFLLPNMNVIDCKILFEDKIVERPRNVLKAVMNGSTIINKDTSTTSSNENSKNENDAKNDKKEN